MKYYLATATILLASMAIAQSVRQSINEDVWRPFIESFNQHDSKSFMELHSRDLVRSSRDSRTVLDRDEYAAQMQRGDENEKQRKLTRRLELRFTERLASDDQAIEVGIYKTTYMFDDKPAKSFYGRFHVVLRREEGKWKILVDTDSSEGNTIDEQDFLAAQPME